MLSNKDKEYGDEVVRSVEEQDANQYSEVDAMVFYSGFIDISLYDNAMIPLTTTMRCSQ